MPKTTRKPGGREDVNVPGLDDSPRQPPSAPAAAHKPAQDKAIGKTKPPDTDMLYITRPERYTIVLLDGDRVEVTATGQDSEARIIPLTEFVDNFEPLLPLATGPLRWKLNINSPQLVPINFCENGEPSPRLIQAYIDEMYAIDEEVPTIPGVLISGPAC